MGLSKHEEELIFELAEKITGSSQQGLHRTDSIVRNVEKRIKYRKMKDLNSYLKLVNSDSVEYNQLVSELTIHTTSWFREMPHFKLIEKLAAAFWAEKPNETFKIWSAGCSTGEEVYSSALSLEALISKNKTPFEYEIDGSDIDPISLDKAKNCIYTASAIEFIPKVFHSFLLKGENKLQGLMTLDAEIRRKSHFFIQNMIEEFRYSPEKKYEVILCRNVLIYFSADSQKKIIANIVKKMNPGGVLILGHCDSFPIHPDLTSIGNSSFVYNPSTKSRSLSQIFHQNKLAKKTVLIVDDSKTVRTIIRKIFGLRFNIIEASSTAEASEIVKTQQVDFVTLDLNMPDENGAAWLQKMRQEKIKIPTIIISESQPDDAEKIFGALSVGAEDYIVKSKLFAEPEKLLDLAEALIVDTDKLPDHPVKLRAFTNAQHKPQLVVVGASTGGPDALIRLFTKMPHDFPPLVIVQHIGHEFSKALLKRLCLSSGLIAGQIDENIPLEPGKIYFATDDYHLQLFEKKSQVFIAKKNAEKVEGHRPSIDVLFESASRVQVDNLGILLTGMGKDGAAGLLKMTETNRTFSLVQDAASSIVYGMPSKAIENGSACFVGNISQIKSEMLKRLGYKN